MSSPKGQPPTSNRGVTKKYQVFYCLDWIQGTIDKEGETETSMFESVQKLYGDTEWSTEGRAQSPYTNVTTCQFASIHWHPEHPEFKYMLRMSGEQLRAFRETGGDELSMLRRLEMQGLNVTRIDLARDIYGTAVRPSTIYNKWRMGEIQTTAKKMTIIQSSSEDGGLAGETVYVGGRSSQRFLRVYDKAAQTETGKPWVRMEIELKGANAKVTAHQIVTHGVKSMFNTIIKTMIIKGLPDWATDGDCIELVQLDAIPRKITNTERWLFATVVPAIEKALVAKVPGFRDAIERMLARTEA